MCLNFYFGPNCPQYPLLRTIRDSLRGPLRDPSRAPCFKGSFTERATLKKRFFACFTCSQTHQLHLGVTKTVQPLQTPTTNGQIHSENYHENHKHKKHQRNQKKQNNKKYKKARETKETKNTNKNNFQNSCEIDGPCREFRKIVFFCFFGFFVFFFVFLVFLVLLQFPWSRCWFPARCFLRAGSLRAVFPLCQSRGLTVACFRVVGYFTTYCNVGSTIPFV